MSYTDPSHFIQTNSGLSTLDGLWERLYSFELFRKNFNLYCIVSEHNMISKQQVITIEIVIKLTELFGMKELGPKVEGFGSVIFSLSCKEKNMKCNFILKTVHRHHLHHLIIQFPTK